MVHLSPALELTHSDESFRLSGVTKRLQVLFEEDEYDEIKTAAEKERMTVAEWVRQALRLARINKSHSLDAKLRAVADAARHDFPTADIEDMLDDISRSREA